MNKNVLKNLFGNKTPITVYGKVTARLSAVRCQVTARGGRILLAEHDQAAKIAIGDPVMVRDGRIIDTGTQAGKHRVYEV